MQSRQSATDGFAHLFRCDGKENATLPGRVPPRIRSTSGTARRFKAEVEAMDPGLPGDPLWPAYAAQTCAQNNASEDCLYVDIWTPSTERAEKLLVYVYYHGGANTASSGHFRLENAANLTREEKDNGQVPWPESGEQDHWSPSRRPYSAWVKSGTISQMPSPTWPHRLKVPLKGRSRGLPRRSWKCSHRI
jgi:hypothetical protein